MLYPQRANLTPGSARFAYRPPVRGEVQVQWRVEIRRNERFEDFARLLARRALWYPTEPLRHTKDAGVHWNSSVSEPTYKGFGTFV